MNIGAWWATVCGITKSWTWLSTHTAAAKSLQSCPTVCDPRDGSPPGSPIPGILQERTLECVAISCSSALKWKVKVKSLSHVRLLATPWTEAYQAPPSMGFSRQEYWSGVPSPSPMTISRSIHFAEMALFHSFLRQSSIPLCTCAISSLPVSLLMGL